jgi:hypothetical protein
MEKIAKIKIISSKELEIIIDLNKNITFDYLLEYLSYGYPQEHFCPCFQFKDYKEKKPIEGNDKVIDLIETNKNTFYISNKHSDKKCHCSELFKIKYKKSKLDLIEYLDLMKKNYKEVINALNDEFEGLKQDQKILEMSNNNSETIDKLKKTGIKGYDLKPRENLAKIDPNNNQIIVNESVNKKNFVDFYDIIIDIKSIMDISKGWEIKMNDRGKENYEKYNNTKNLKIGIIGNSNKGKSFLLSKISKIYLPSGTSIEQKA